jgi:hypothetical protein
MNDLSKPAHFHNDHEHAQGGGCCGGGADAKAKPLAVPADKAAPADDTGTKPAKLSGCCCG